MWWCCSVAVVQVVQWHWSVMNVIPTCSFVSLNHLPGGGEHHRGGYWMVWYGMVWYGMVIPTYSFVSLHHLPGGGEHHRGRVHVADVPAVSPHLQHYHLLSSISQWWVDICCKLLHYHCNNYDLKWLEAQLTKGAKAFILIVFCCFQFICCFPFVCSVLAYIDSF